MNKIKHKVYSLKTWPEHFQNIKRGLKTFELRYNDRDYQVGNELILQEYDPETEEYTGDHIHAVITHIMGENDFLDMKGFVIMSIKLQY